MKNTHRVYVKNGDGTESLKASGKQEFCNVIAAKHRGDGHEVEVRPIPEDELK